MLKAIMDVVSSFGEVAFWVGIMWATWKHNLMTGLLPKGLSRVIFWGLFFSVVGELVLMVIK